MVTRNDRPVRILVVDDHETVRKGIMMILSASIDTGEYGEAADGLEAVEKAHELAPDLIILDITMPKLGGFEAARQIRKLYPQMPILFLSMHEGKHIVESAKSIPVQGFVMKNQVGQTLLNAVHALLGGQTFFQPT